MLKALILSHHFPPMNVIGALRAQGYADHFLANGIRPTIVTHDWNKKTLKDQYCSEEGFFDLVTITKQDNYDLITLPVVDWKSKFWFQKLHGGKWNKLAILGAWSKGFLDTSPESTDSYRSYKKFLFDHLTNHQYDIVIAVFSPHHHLRLAHEIHQKFGIPYVQDHRDLWDDRIVMEDYSPNKVEKLQDKYCYKYWKKWGKDAAFVSITSKEWLVRLKKITGNSSGAVIHNGFEQNLYQDLEHRENGIFKVVHNGSLYNHQRLDIFLNGVKKFIEEFRPEDFKLEFIGADRLAYKQSFNSFLGNPKEFLEKFIPSSYLLVTKRKPRTEALQHVKDAQLLLFPALPGVKGRHFGKIFEYIGSGRNVIMVPNDHSSGEEVIKNTSSGVILNSETEVYEHLKQKYSEWKSTNTLKYEGNTDAINTYTRESQTKIMCTAIKKHLSGKV